jgi:hypothetical protein
MAASKVRKKRGGRHSHERRFTLDFVSRCVIVDYQHLVRLPNVLSLAVGLKHVKGKLRRVLCVTAFVDHKPKPRMLRPGDRVPARTAVMAPVSGGFYRRRLLPTDVVMIQGARLHGFNQRTDPVRPGLGIGGRAGQFGTLGCLVADAASGQPLMLTCAHVVTPNGLVGQPGGFAQPPPEIVVGRTRRTVQTPFNVPQWMDAAVMDLASQRGFEAEPTMCEDSRVSAVAPLSSIVVGMPVSKCGAATEGTGGRVTHYDAFRLPEGNLFGVIVIAGDPGLCAPGDSGAVWRDKDGRAVALHCAGTQNGWAAALPFGLALQAVGARVVPKAESAAFAARLQGGP